MHYYFYIVETTDTKSSGVIGRDDAELAFSAITRVLNDRYSKDAYIIIKFERIE